MTIIICAKLPFIDQNGGLIPAETQANMMLDFIENIVSENSSAEIYLTYSANEAQSLSLKNHRQNAKNKNDKSVNELALIQGRNQAEVCFEMAVKIGLRERLPLSSAFETESEHNSPIEFTTAVDTGSSFDDGGSGLSGFFGFNEPPSIEEGGAVAAAADNTSTTQVSSYSFQFFEEQDQSERSNTKAEEQATDAAAKKEYPNIHIIPITTITYTETMEKTSPSDDVVKDDIAYFNDIQQSDDESKLIIVWGNQDTDIAIAGGIALGVQSASVTAILNEFSEQLQKKLAEENTFNLAQPTEMKRAADYVQDNIAATHRHKRVC